MKRIVFSVCICAAFLAGVAQRVNAQVGPPPPKPDCREIVYRKWNNVLFVDNSEEQFVAYQWYKNNSLMPGETRQFLHSTAEALAGDGNIYHVIATTASETQVVSCEGRFEDFPASAPLNPGQIIRRAVLYNFNGEKVGEWNDKPEHLRLAQGCYIWLLTDEQGNTWSEKFTK